MKAMPLQRAFVMATLAAAALAFTACRTAEQPNYQGRSGSAPKVTDYYPSKTNHVAEPK